MTATEETIKPMLLQLRPNQLTPAIDNLRSAVDEKGEDFKALLESVKAIGVQTALEVTPKADGSGWMIVAGHRRHRAATLAKCETVPCVERAFTETERVLHMLVENLLRVDLDPMEEAAGYFRCIGLGLTVKDLAKKVGRPVARVSERLALCELPKEVRDKVQNGNVTLEGAKEYVALSKAGVKTERIAKMDPQQAQAERKKLERQAKVSAKVKELAKEGVQAFEKKQKGWQPLRSYGGVSVDATRHVKEPCHVLVVEMDTWATAPSVSAYCNDPSRHLPGGGSRLKDENAIRRAQVDAERANQPPWQEMQQRRQYKQTLINEAVIRYSGLNLSKDAQLATLAAYVLDSLDTEEAAALCEVFGLELTDDGEPGDEATAKLKGWMTDGSPAKQLQRVLHLDILTWMSNSGTAQVTEGVLAKYAGYEPYSTDDPIPTPADDDQDEAPAEADDVADDEPADGPGMTDHRQIAEVLGEGDDFVEPLDDDGYYDPALAE